MRYIAFLKKEALEYVRTYRLFILLMVFLVLGFLNPITAKYTPVLMSQILPDGMQMELPEPTVFDTWAQFFKNVFQMGVIVVVIMYASLLSGELNKGTLINMLTKGLSRDDVILAKFTMASLIWTLCFLVSTFVTYSYSLLFWESYFSTPLAFALCMLWIFGIFLISLVLLGQAITKTASGGLLLSALGVVICMLLTIVPSISTYSPAVLMQNNMALVQESSTIMDCLPAVGITILLIICTVSLTIFIFRKRQL